VFCEFGSEPEFETVVSKRYHYLDHPRVFAGCDVPAFSTSLCARPPIERPLLYDKSGEIPSPRNIPFDPGSVTLADDGLKLCSEPNRKTQVPASFNG